MKTKIPFQEALSLATFLVERLGRKCERIEIAGSIRRKRPEIGDIELVAIPKFVPDMFGEPSQTHELDVVDWSRFGVWVKGGHKLKQIILHEGIQLDLSIVTPPAQWGLIFLLRTGPDFFSHRLVTKRNEGGLLPSNMNVRGGALWLNDHMVETPEEQDVFKAIGLPYLEPEDRV